MSAIREPKRPFERLEADYRGTGLTVGKHPMHYLGGDMEGMDVLSSRDIEASANGQRVRDAGAVITRQRRDTGEGFCFVTLEDETGVSNSILSPQVLQAHRLVITHESFLLAEETLQNTDGMAAVKTEVLRALKPPVLGIRSHEFD